MFFHIGAGFPCMGFRCWLSPRSVLTLGFSTGPGCALPDLLAGTLRLIQTKEERELEWGMVSPRGQRASGAFALCLLLHTLSLIPHRCAPTPPPPPQRAG